MKNLFTITLLFLAAFASAQPVRTTITDDGTNVTIATPVNTRVVPICDFHWTFIDGTLQMWMTGRNELIPGGRLGNFTINGATTQASKLAALGAISDKCAGGGLDSLYLSDGTLLSSGDTIPTSGGGVSTGDKGDIDVVNASSDWRIDTNAITAIKIASNSIDSTKIATGGIGNTDLANSIVTSSKITDATITNSDLGNGVGGIYKSDGTAPSDIDITITDSINFDAGTLFINGLTDRVGIGASAVLPSAQLSVRRDNIGVTQDNSYGIVLANSTPASAGAQQMSPGIRWRANGWKTSATAASQTVDFLADVLPVQGTSAPTGIWQLKSSINGGYYFTLFEVGSAGTINIGNNPVSLITTNSNSSFAPSYGGRGLVIQSQLTSLTDNNTVTIRELGMYGTSGTNAMFSVVGSMSSTSGTMVMNTVSIAPTINQTGGANGITRGVYVNPTLTSASDWRSVETSNNTGYQLYQSGTGKTRIGGLMEFGGSTTSFPALKRSTTNLQVRLADDSGFTFIEDLYRRAGSGSPEGVVTAPVGAIYHRTDGGAGTSLYVKESGTGNTGWVAK